MRLRLPTKIEVNEGKKEDGRRTMEQPVSTPTGPPIETPMGTPIETPMGTPVCVSVPRVVNFSIQMGDKVVKSVNLPVEICVNPVLFS